MGSGFSSEFCKRCCVLHLLLVGCDVMGRLMDQHVSWQAGLVAYAIYMLFWIVLVCVAVRIWMYFWIGCSHVAAQMMEERMVEMCVGYSRAC